MGIAERVGGLALLLRRPAPPRRLLLPRRNLATVAGSNPFTERSAEAAPCRGPLSDDDVQHYFEQARARGEG